MRGTFTRRGHHACSRSGCEGAAIARGLCSKHYQQEHRSPYRRSEEPCRHCRRKRTCCPRGLCWGCYYTPDVRARYPRDGKPGADDPVRSRGPAPRRARGLPGTAAKVEALQGRAAALTDLWHPADARRDLH